LGKSVNGPDMQDCLTYLLQMDAQNHLETTILLIPLGTATAPSCTISLLSAPVKATLDQDLEVYRSSYEYPNRDTRTFGAAVYRAIVEHDKFISKECFWEKTTKKA